MKNIINLSLSGFCLALFLVGNAFAFKVDTHKAINEFVADPNFTLSQTQFNLDQYLVDTLGFQQGVTETVGYNYSMSLWGYSSHPTTVFDSLVAGGAQEDDAPRYLNHFHDPVNNRGLGDSDSAVLWAQKPAGAQKARGNYSWFDARDNFYAALTATSTQQRREYFNKTFRAVGQLMHLIEDMAVPEHTRNDLHVFSPPMEVYTNEILNEPNAPNILLSQPSFFDFNTLQIAPSPFIGEGATVPVANLFDTDSYQGNNPDITTQNTIGLAEYTNANFLSSDTNYRDSISGFNFPRRSSTVMTLSKIPDPRSPSQTIDRWYDVKTAEGETNGGIGYKLTATSVLALYVTTVDDTTDTFYFPMLDEHVITDYARLLLPRAVGYAASLVNYFFRGQIELSLPERATHAIITPEQGSFSDIRMKARNITVNGEELSNGTIELVVKFKRSLQDPFQGVFMPVTDEFEYVIVPEATGRTSIPSDRSVELVFDLGATSIPLWATDLTFQLVYRGRMGVETAEGFAGEENAVAVGFKDVSEPTVVDYINSMDLVCINDQILVAGSDAAVNALDSNGNLVSSHADVYPHEIIDSYLKFSPAGALKPASSTSYDVTVATLPSGSYARFYVITEPIATYNNIAYQMKTNGLDNRDSSWHLTKSVARSYQGMINQENYIKEDDVWARYYSALGETRGIRTWAGIQWLNTTYPSNGTCDVDSASIPLSGPEPVVLQRY